MYSTKLVQNCLPSASFRIMHNHTYILKNLTFSCIRETELFKEVEKISWDTEIRS